MSHSSLTTIATPPPVFDAVHLDGNPYNMDDLAKAAHDEEPAIPPGFTLR